jgi:hypothetical protein
MISTFYAAFAPICFTLLGLWLVVVQTRHAEWRHSALLRRRAYSISLSFAFPGLMGLLSLVDPTSRTVWRVSFAVVAVVGLAAAIALWLPTRRRGESAAAGHLASVTTTLTALIYVVIITVALVPDIAGHLGAAVTGLQVEAFTLCALVFLGVNVACYLVFEEGEGRPSR